MSLGFTPSNWKEFLYFESENNLKLKISNQIWNDEECETPKRCKFFLGISHYILTARVLQTTVPGEGEGTQFFLDNIYVKFANIWEIFFENFAKNYDPLIYQN